MSSKSFGPFIGKAPIAGTGKVSVRSGFKAKEGADTYETLKSLLEGLDESPEYKAITDYGLALLSKDRIDENLGLAKNLIADRTAATSKGLSRSLIGRGVASSGIGSSALLSANSSERASLINDALARAFSENLAEDQTALGALSGNLGNKQNFAQILSNFVASLLSQGIQGQTSIYGARQGALNNQATNQFQFASQVLDKVVADK